MGLGRRGNCKSSLHKAFTSQWHQGGPWTTREQDPASHPILQTDNPSQRGGTNEPWRNEGAGSQQRGRWGDSEKGASGPVPWGQAHPPAVLRGRSPSGGPAHKRWQTSSSSWPRRHRGPLRERPGRLRRAGVKGGAGRALAGSGITGSGERNPEAHATVSDHNISKGKPQGKGKRKLGREFEDKRFRELRHRQFKG